MINLECRKFDWIANDYLPHGYQQVDEATAKKIIDIYSQKPPVMGFYQYRFILGGQVFVVYTLCADLAGFIQNVKTER